MANYREFYEQTRRRKRKAARRRFVAAIVVLGAVLAAALLLVRCGKQAEPAPAATEEPQATAAPAPLKAQTGREDDGSWNTREPVEQTIDGEIRSADYRMLALPANGKADSSYLNGVTFLGDSLTQGFQTYTGLEAKDRSYFCAYKGMGVKQVVDDAAVKNLAGEEQVPMQALIDSQPDNVYVELGVNTLNNTTDESFIAYYDRMLERLTDELPDGVGIYVQALPPIREEKRLLALAEKVCYVSPLTLRNQQHLFPESAEKMFWQPLPYYYKDSAVEQGTFDHNVYGYFGAYYPAARDLQPFYEAAKKTGVEVNICGDPANLFEATAQIHIHPRLPLNELKPIEDSTNVLIFLCNRKGGQIPGKIYQYSATDKTILFIMDGTEEEQRVLREYFGQFNRYVFCQNRVSDIAEAIRRIESGELGDVRNVPLDDFDPVRTVTNILEAGR